MLFTFLKKVLKGKQNFKVFLLFRTGIVSEEKNSIQFYKFYQEKN